MSQSRAESQDRLLARHVIDGLDRAFSGDGWRVEAEPDGHPVVDLLCRKGDRSCAVEVKAMAGRARRALLRALLADAILQVKAAARILNAAPLAVVAAPRLSDAMVAELRDYAQAYAPEVSWGAGDGLGRLDLHGPGLEGVRSRARSEIPAGVPRVSAPGREARDPFSDLGQWMIKVLLASRISPRHLSAPREPAGGVRDLSRQAGVSVASASRLLAALGSLGYVDSSAREMRLIRVRSLLELWRPVVLRPHRERYARFLLPAGESAGHMARLLSRRRSARDAGGHPGEWAGARGERACLALFSASRSLDLGWVRGAPEHLYCEDLSDSFLENLGLFPVVGRHEADLVVRRPRFPEAVFRACVQRDGVPVADALQCWLDLSGHPARGDEQAQEILERIGLLEEGRD